MRKFSYRFKTETLSTDDENIASVLFHANELQALASVLPSDKESVIRILHETFCTVADMKDHFMRFVETANGEIITVDHIQSVADAFDNIIHTLDAAKNSTAPASEKRAIIATACDDIMKIIPSVTAFDDLTAGRI